jgi:tRNA(Ile)-lysidine synthase
VTPPDGGARFAAAAAQAFAAYANCERVLVGVSGGPDSLALLLLLVRWARPAGGPRIDAATVDHGLRASSRAEAEAVARICADLQVPHHLLLWTGDKPATRLQERARDARYRLLQDCAAAIGADVLMTAHHADDQAETILFRLLRGSGPAGLAGMERESWRGSLRHARPLLGWRKSELIAVCEAAGLAYAQDPSNRDPRFARTHLRALLDVLAAEGLGPDALLRLGARAQRAEQALAAFARRVVEDLPARREPRLFQADAAGLAGIPREILLRILMQEVARVGEAGRPPRLERAEALAERLTEAIAQRGGLRGTLGGTLVRLDPKTQVLTIRPEAGRRHSAAQIAEETCEFPIP